MNATVEWKDGVRFEVSARGHKIVCDQPRDLGGSDAGMTPPEFLLASLGACAAYYAAEYLRARGLSQAGLRVEIEAEKALQPARLDGFRIVVEAPSADEPRHREGIERAVKRCLIHNTLLHAPSISVAVEAPVTI